MNDYHFVNIIIRTEHENSQKIQLEKMEELKHKNSALELQISSQKQLYMEEIAKAFGEITDLR